MISEITWYEIIIRLVVATVLGCLFGIEREIHKRPAGLRTNALVALSSSLVMMLSMYGFEGTFDTSRLAAAVISGIGFIGAGAILHEGVNIKGLTTAATLWVVSIVGLAIGGGFYFEGCITSFIGIIILIVLRITERGMGKRNFITLEVAPRENLISDIISTAKAHGLEIRDLSYNTTRKKKENIVCISFEITMSEETYIFFQEIQSKFNTIKADCN